MAEPTTDSAADRPSIDPSSPKFDARLAEGVAYFEQMLEIMPEDRTTLEFLVVAYAQLGDRVKGQKALVGLTRLLIKEKDVNALQGLVPWLEASDNDTAKALLLKVKLMTTAPAPDLTPEAPKPLTDKERLALATVGAVKSEFALVDVLQSGGVIGDEDATIARDQLQFSADSTGLFLVSALQILEKENKPKCDWALEFLADKYGTPPIPLAAFDVQKPMFAGYDELIVRLRGVVPFAKLGNLTLIAMLSPGDKELRASLEAVGPCRFFLADPAAIEAALNKVFGSEEDKK